MTRWHGPFETPNIAALAMASLAVTLLPLCIHWWRIGRRCLAVLAGSGVLANVILAAATGSRAGALALIAGSLVLAWRRAIPAWTCMVLMVAMVVSSWSLPLGARSFASVGDASITHRLSLWHATLMLIGDHPWTGVGPGRCMAALDDWYLPASMRGTFYSPINSVLALAAYFGLWMVGLAAAIAYLIARALTVPTLRGTALPAIALALLTVHAIGSLFQGHWYFRSWWWIAVPSAALVVFAIVRCFPSDDRRWAHRLQIAAALGLGVSCIGAAIAVPVARGNPIRTCWHGPVLVGQMREVGTPPILLVLSDSGTRRGGSFEVRLCESLVSAGFASAVIANDEALPAGSGILVLHKRAAEIMEAFPDHPLIGHPLVLLDPWIASEPGDTNGSTIRSAKLILSPYAPFVDPDLCQRWAEQCHMPMGSIRNFSEIGRFLIKSYGRIHSASLTR